MNIAKQTHIQDDDAVLVHFACRNYPADHHIARHQHLRGQLLHAISGIMTVNTDSGSWTVPPQQAVWIPPKVSHEVFMPCAVSMRSLNLREDIARALSADCKVVEVTSLLRELIKRLVTQEHHAIKPLERLMAVLVDEVQRLKSSPLHLPAPQDSRVCQITDALINNPADERDLTQWALAVGASSRTLARRFRKETGLSFRQWRQQLRLLKAIELLALGQDVTAVALTLGYQSPSAFIAMFKRALGETPGKFIH